MSWGGGGCTDLAPVGGIEVGGWENMLMIHLGSRVRPPKGMFKKQQLISPSITSWGGCPITAGLWLGDVGWEFIVGARINCSGPRGEASHAI